MILQQLNEDADAIVQHILGEELPPPMYDRRPVRWFLDLNDQGEASASPFIPLESEGKRGKKGTPQLVPVLTRSGTRPPPVLLVDTPAYVLGVGDDKRASEKHASFKDLVAACAAATHEPKVAAVARFLEQYIPGTLEVPPEMGASDLVAFRVGDRLPIELPSIRDFWARIARPKADGEAELQCLVCGKVRPIPEFLPLKIKGIPEGQTSGTALVSANVSVFESFGLARARTSPVCDPCGERSHKALNALLGSDQHHLRVGRLVYVFWAPSGWSPVPVLAPQDPAVVRELLREPHTGRQQQVRRTERFAAAALSASGGRAVVRSWLRTTVQEAKEHLRRWETWQRLVAPKGDEPRYHSVYHLAASLYRDFNKENHAPVIQVLVETALTGVPLPDALLAAAVRRIHAVGLPERGREALSAYSRVALMKAVLASQRALAEGDRWMTERESSEMPAAYHWGSLLAVLEIIQRKALERPGKPLNSTIVDRYYGRASTAPGTVFGRLLAGAQDHLKKIRGPMDDRRTANALNRRIEEIVHDHLIGPDGASPQDLSGVLTLKEQALFALGYYHERAKNRAEGRAGAERKRLRLEQSTEDSGDEEEQENE